MSRKITISVGPNAYILIQQMLNQPDTDQPKESNMDPKQKIENDLAVVDEIINGNPHDKLIQEQVQNIRREAIEYIAHFGHNLPSFKGDHSHYLECIRILNDNNPQPKYLVAVGFDGTCVTHEYPFMGVDCPNAVVVLHELVKRGAGIILLTMRHGPELMAAIAWFENRRIPLYSVNINPTQHKWTQSRKVYAHLYIDDAALGCPLIYNPEISKRPFVDWVGVDRMLKQHDWYVEPIHS